MEITNTLSKQKEEFIPRAGKTVKMFVCGPTVYDYIHIGNARTFLFFDVAAKYLRQRGYQVEYIQNITDIDDKIIDRARKATGSNADIAQITADIAASALTLAKEYTEIFREDMLALGITAVDKYAAATDYIKEVITQVRRLIDKGNAYQVEGDGWYFDLSTFSDYGKLSGRTTQMAEDAVSRIDDNPNKRNKGDFALWKFSKPGEPSWDSELGPGRPGWHIEDTAITEKYFGPQYDLHGGGQDLIFPHHEAEIAQQESASGLKPFVKYWLHVGFLVNKDKKMSKSLGNFATLHELLGKYSREVLRFYLFSAHYRSPLDFSADQLKSAEAAVARLGEFAERLRRLAGADVALAPAVPSPETRDGNLLRDWNREMGDDFNTPRTLAVIFETIKKVNVSIDAGSLSAEQAGSLLSQLLTINEVLGIVPAAAPEIPEPVRGLIARREALRQAKNFSQADQLRSQLSTLGWQIDDTAYGSLAKPIKK